ncbi:MAG: O-methyltransferase [Bacteroidota bacterium]|nr:O-methyltransferase [Bacteroidota bacterium]
MNISQELEQYISDHMSPEGDILEDLRRKTYLKTPYPNMISGPLQGKFLELISKMLKPDRILEIGTFTGYSAICLASGLAEGGRLDTIDSNDETYEMAAEYFMRAGMESRIHQIKGDALEIMKRLDKQYDLIFIDGEKREYMAYYELAIELLRKGGIILADNVLWGGKVVDENEKNDPATAGILAFNKRLSNDKRVELVILPVRDGLSLIRKI